MNKKGFTLVELLVVIAIIGILSLLIVPNVIKINQSVNERVWEQKKEDFESAAELYGSNNDDIFNGASEVEVTVEELLANNYLTADIKAGEDGCDAVKSDNKEYMYPYGCVTDPTTGGIVNDKIIKLTKKTVGIVAEYVEGNPEETSNNSSSKTLVAAVCELISTTGGIDLDGNDCSCTKESDGSYTLAVDECLIVSKKDSGDVDNWLKYGSSEANWRVIGVYNVNGKLSAKMITSKTVD